MASLSLRHIYKIYPGNVRAVSDFNLEIDDKEFIVFVGPSGCGKSTTLRMVAGLEEISAGELYIDGKLVNDVEPKDRDIAMVFQNYALYPHMTVYDNMAFGLRLRKMNSKDIDDRVKEAAAILGITPLLTRKPKALSGGQRQRVALGRAIVREPKVFLLDEPLSNLDAKLRVQMRTEITKLHNRLATTFIYVTHDQTEAMTMGTRIVVMKDGIVQQVDTPQFLYDYPDNLFVASFLGSPQMNFFKATLVKEGAKLYATFGANKIEIPDDKAKKIIDEAYIGREVILGVRPEDIHDEEIFISSSPNTIIDAYVDVIEKLGNETYLYMNVDGKEDYTIARIDARTYVKANEHVKLAIDAHHIHLFDPDTELTIMGVPKYNRFEAEVVEKDGQVSVEFGKISIPLSSDITSRFTTGLIGKKVVLGIAPGDLSQEQAEGAIEIDAVADFYEQYPRYNAVYSSVEGKSSFMIAKHDLDNEVKNGQKLKYYFLPENIELFDPENGNKLIAYKPVSSNTTKANVAVKEGVATVRFGRSKLVFKPTDALTDGTYDLTIDYEKTNGTKAALDANPKMIISGNVVDADVIGSKTIVYAKVDGFDPYFTALIDGAPSLNIGDKIKFAVEVDALKFN